MVQGVAVFAQPERVFKGGDISESALIDALKPQAAEAAAPGGLTRSFGPRPVDQNASPPKRPSAPMLITFVTNSAELTPKAKDMLAVLARALQSDKLAQFKFSIEGHADPRGVEELNLQLSQLRAEAVVKYLSEQQNISESRLVAVGKGQSELMNTRDPSAPENRRVTVKTVVQ